MKRAPRKPRASQDRDPLFNQSVEKAFTILEAFGGERRAMNLGEIATAAGMTKSSAQRCTHTLERLGYLRRDLRVRRWVLTPRAGAQPARLRARLFRQHGRLGPLLLPCSVTIRCCEAKRPGAVCDVAESRAR